MKMLNEHVSADVLKNLKLNMICNNEENGIQNDSKSIISKEQYENAMKTYNPEFLAAKQRSNANEAYTSIKKSWIYQHFQKSGARKIALYVNAGPGFEIKFCVSCKNLAKSRHKAKNQ